MTIKKRIPNNIDNKAIENLANELADKPYGQKQDTLVRTTISLPSSVLYKLEDMALNNKRKKDNLRSVSAILRHCIKKCLQI
jgi:hypothetical protein